MGSPDPNSLEIGKVQAVLKLAAAQRIRLTIIDEMTEDQREIGYVADFESAAKLVGPGHRLWSECFDNKWAPLLLADMAGKIAPEIRGDFDPSSLSIWFGRDRTIIEDQEGESLRDLGELYFSITFFGYGFPRDVARFEEQIFLLPCLLELERKLSSIIGPVVRYTSLAT
jgi:hypothetical protein